MFLLFFVTKSLFITTMFVMEENSQQLKYSPTVKLITTS